MQIFFRWIFSYSAKKGAITYIVLYWKDSYIERFVIIHGQNQFTILKEFIAS